MSAACIKLSLPSHFSLRLATPTLIVMRRARRSRNLGGRTRALAAMSSRSLSAISAASARAVCGAIYTPPRPKTPPNSRTCATFWKPRARPASPSWTASSRSSNTEALLTGGNESLSPDSAALHSGYACCKPHAACSASVSTARLVGEMHRHSKILGLQLCALGDADEHSWTDDLAVVKGEDHIGPAGAREGLM